MTDKIPDLKEDIEKALDFAYDLALDNQSLRRLIEILFDKHGVYPGGYTTANPYLTAKNPIPISVGGGGGTTVIGTSTQPNDQLTFGKVKFTSDNDLLNKFLAHNTSNDNKK